MEIKEIIEDAFLFPSKNIKVLMIYVVLAVIVGLFSTFGMLVYALGFLVPECFMWGGLAVVIAMVIGWMMSGYLISVIKSGIDLDDNVPEFVWWDNFITGFDNFIVSIVYFLIPAFIVLVMGYVTNVYGNIMAVAAEIISEAQAAYLGTSSAIAYDALSQAIVNLAVSLAATITVAVGLFVIFSFLQTMAQARLANTGSLGEALNVVEAAKDITRIGVGKVVALILLIIIIVFVIQMILSAIYSYMPALSILSLIVSPYMVFFAQRAVGLLYSDIA